MADSYQNKISILITAQDEASAVLEATSAQVTAAQEELTASAQEAAAAFVSLGDSAEDLDANLAIIAAETEGAVGGITLLGEASEGTSDIVIASNDAMIASYREVTEAATDAGAGSGITKGAFGAAGLGGLISNPYVMAGAAIVGATLLVVKSAADFQQAVTRLYTTAGETAPLKALDSAILQVATDTGESTSQLALAQYHISSIGYDALSGVNLLKAAAEGAKAEGANVTDVANALGTVMHDYGASTSQAVSYMNQLITTTSLGNMTLEDLSTSLSTVLPKAHEVGLSFAQVGAAEATLTEGGVQAAQATQDLSALIMGLVAPTAQQVTAMQAMGLNSVELSKNLGKEGLTGTLDELMTAVTAHEQDGQIVQSAFKNATLATQDLNTELANSPPQLKGLEQELLTGSISFASFRSEVQALPEGLTNLGKQFEGTYNSAHSFNTQLVSAINASPTVANELKMLTGQSNSLNAVLMLTGANQAVFDANNQKIAASAQNSGANIEGWSKVQGNLNTQLDELWQRVMTMAIVIGDRLLPVITLLVRGLNDVLTAWIAWDDILNRFFEHAANDIVQWYQDTVQYVNDAATIWGNLMSFLAGVADSIGRYFQSVWDNPEAALKGYADDLTRAFNRILSDLAGWAITAGTTIWHGLQTGFRDVVRNAPQWGRDAVNAYVDGLKALGAYDIESLLQWGNDAMSVYHTGVAMGKQILDGIVAGFKATVSSYVQLGKDVIGAVYDGIKLNIRMARAGGKDIIEALVDGLAAQVKDVVHFFADLPNLLNGPVRHTGMHVAQAQLDGMSDTFKDVGKMHKLGDDILKGLGIAILAVLAAVALLAASLGIAIMNGIIKGIKDQVQALIQAISDMWGWVKGAFDKFGNDIANWATQAVDSIVTAFKQMPDKIKNAVTSAGSSFVKDIGKDLHIPGFAAGTGYAPGGLSLVGENGPELVNLPQGSQVLSAAETRSAFGANGKTIVIQQLNVNNNVDAGMVIRQIGWQLATAV